MIRALSAILAGALLALPLPAGGEAGEALPASDSWRDRLIELVHAAVSNSPDLRAMEHEVEAARHRVPQADALPEPEVEIGLKDVPVQSPSLTRDDFTMEMVTWRQALPARGEREARRAVAAAEVEGVVAAHGGHLIEVAAMTADSFFALAGIDQQLAILRGARLRLESAAAAAIERFRVGQGGQADVLRANLELTELEEAILTLQAARSAATARLNALLGRAIATPVEVVAPLPDDLDAQLSVPALEELDGLAEQRSPAVLAAQSSVAAAEGEVRLAALERRPDLMLSSYYGRRERFDDFIGVSAAVTLPWARRHRLAASRAEKESTRDAAQARVEATRARLRGDVGEVYAELEKARRQLHLYRDVILPQAEIHYESAREAYIVGRVDFLTFVSAASELDRYHLEAAERRAGIGRAVATLQRVTGLPLVPGTPAQGNEHESH
jgi:cobalt-zinc-cadmium efflux system outer membrane protein